MSHKFPKSQSINAEALDRLFDEGEEDVLQYFDLSQVKRPGIQRPAHSSKMTTQEVYRFLGEDWQNTLKDCQIGQFRVTNSHYVLHISQDEWAVLTQ
jgi:hypothetical protein